MYLWVGLAVTVVAVGVPLATILLTLLATPEKEN